MPDGEISGTAPTAGDGAVALKNARVGLIGGGFTGICAAIFLRDKLGIQNIIGVERHNELGGTWFENTYPGLACDCPAPVYSFSFALNPDWSCPFPFQPELLRYMLSVAKRFDVRRHFTFCRKTLKVEWHADLGVWRVHYIDLVPPAKGEPTTKDTKEIEGSEGYFDCEFLFNSCHTTNEPGLPMIPGATEGVFQGDNWHSMRWPKDGLDRVKGKRVALVGCAAAAVQLVPQLAPLASKLCVYHRTPNHVVERPNEPFPEDLKAKLRSDPLEMRLFRAEYEEKFARSWVDTGMKFGSEEHKKSMESARRNLDTNIKDPKLREILWPEFQIWCRRVLFHSDFYPALARENVELVQERIIRIEKDGILTAEQNSRDKEIDESAPEKKREFDVIIWATGWAAPGGKARAFPVIGLNGVEYGLRSVNIIPDGPEKMELQSYFGQMLDHFPNYFSPCSPSGLALYSVVQGIEDGVDYCLKVIRYALTHNLKSIVPRMEATKRWCAKLDEKVKGTPYNEPGNCSSYHKMYHADGTYTNRIHYPGMPSELASVLKFPIWSDFDTEKLPEGVQWVIPAPPLDSQLDRAYQQLIHVVDDHE